MALFLNGQNAEPKELNHQILGTWIMPNTDAGVKVSVGAYSTFSKHEEKRIDKEINAKQNIYKLNAIQQDIRYVNTTIYCYKLYLISKSIYQGDSTGTWIYNARIYINDMEVTDTEFPDGFPAYIQREPTLLYEYDTTDPKEIVNYSIKWESATYENRITRKNN